MSDEIFGFDDADPTGRRKALKQMAAGAGGVALVWAAPTLTRTDRASAAASDPGGGGGGCASFSYLETFVNAVVSWSNSGGYDTPGSIPGSGGNPDILVFQGSVNTVGIVQPPSGSEWMWHGAQPFWDANINRNGKAVELAGDDRTSGGGPSGQGGISVTLSLAPGTYTLTFPYTFRVGPPIRAFSVALTGGDTTPISFPTSVMPPSADTVHTYTGTFTVNSLGSVTISMADTLDSGTHNNGSTPNQDYGVLLTNLSLTCA